MMVQTEIIEKKTENIDFIIENLKKNKLIIMPTNSVYGVMGNGQSEEVVDRIYNMKGRDRSKPLAFYTSKKQAGNYGYIDSLVQSIIDLWPAQISVIVKKKRKVVPDFITSNMDSVLLTCLDEFVEKMANKTDIPIIATSANLSGNASNITFEQVYQDFNGIADVIVRGDCSKSGLSSTIVNFTYQPPLIQRIGSFDVNKVKEFIPDAKVGLNI